MKNKFKFSLIIFILVILGCFTSIFAADVGSYEVGTTNLKGTAENSAKVGDILYHPEKGWTRYDDTDYKMLFNGRFNDWPSSEYYGGSTKYGNGSVTIKFYGSKFRILISYCSSRSNDNFVYVDGEKLGQFDQIRTGWIPQAIGFEKTGLTEGIHVLKIDLGNNSTFDALDIDSAGYLIYLSQNVTLNKSTDVITSGQTDTLTAAVAPDSAADKSLKWTSSDESIATVDQTGKITALKGGQAVITATTQDGSNLSASCTVNVEDRTVKLILNMTNGTLRQYTISKTEFNNFLIWYYARANNQSNVPCYIFDIPQTASSSERKDYVLFNNIETFEVE